MEIHHAAHPSRITGTTTATSGRPWFIRTRYQAGPWRRPRARWILERRHERRGCRSLGIQILSGFRILSARRRPRPEWRSRGAARWHYRSWRLCGSPQIPPDLPL